MHEPPSDNDDRLEEYFEKEVKSEFDSDSDQDKILCLDIIDSIL